MSAEEIIALAREIDACLHGGQSGGPRTEIIAAVIAAYLERRQAQ